MVDKKQKTIKKLTEELLEKLEVEATVDLSEKDEAVWVTINSDEPGVLIGHYGRNLESIQILLGQMIFKKLGEWVRIVVTVGDYREKRELQLKELAISVATKVVQTGTPVFLSDLTPAERRIVHTALTDHPDVVSQSEGEGRFRKLVVKPRSNEA